MSQPVGVWIQTVNRAREVYEWSYKHTFVAASKALEGVAKVCLVNQPGIDTRTKLEAELKREFEKKVSQSDIHRLMDEKIRKKDQTTEQFFQKMRNLGRQGGLNDEDVINYIVNGIFEDETARMSLIGATTFEKLKKRIEACSRALKFRTSES